MWGFGSERWLWMTFCTAKQLKYYNRRKVIIGWAAKGDFPRGGGGCTLSGHHITVSLTIAWHSISCESRTLNSFEHCTLLEVFRNKKNESGLYNNFSNSTIMNKNKQVSHSKQETINVVFTHPSPTPLPPRIKCDIKNMTNLT